MRGYFGLGQLSASEKSDILNQHKSLYNGYQTMQPQVSNTQPLYVYDFAGDKDGMVVNNKGEVKKYTNMGINEQVENNEVCDECGAMIMDGMCNECGYGHMEESELEEGNMCEQCGGTMKENVCEQCGSGKMEEGTGHLDDIYNVRDLNLTKGDFDYVEGGGNDYGTFEKAHHMKKMKNEQVEDDDDYLDYESSYTEDGMDDPDNEDDGFEDMNLDEIEVDKLSKGGKYKYHPKYKPEAEDEVEFMDRIDYEDNSKPHYQFSGKKSNYLFPDREIEDFISSLDEQGGNVDDMDVDDVEDAYDFVSNGPGGVYPVNEDDMYGYEPEMTYETMESAWADEEIDEQDVSGSQGIYGDMKRAYDFDSGGPGKGGPYQEFSYESELDEEDEFGFATHSGDFGGDDSEDEFGFATHSGDFGGDDSEDDDWEEIDVDMKESFITQKNKITEMFNRIGKFN
jgi:hypothetical protein